MDYGGGGGGDGGVRGGPGRGEAAPYRPTGVVWPPPPPGSTPVTVRRPPPSTSPAPQAAASSSSTSTPDKLVRQKAMEIALAPPAAASPDGEALASDNLAQIKTALGGVCIETNHQDDKIRRFSVDKNGTRCCLDSSSESGPWYSKKLNNKKGVTGILSQWHKQTEQKAHEVVIYKRCTASGSAVTLFLIMMSLICTVRGSNHGTDCEIGEYSTSIAQVCQYGAPPAVCCDLLQSAVHACGNASVLCEIGRSVPITSRGFNVHDVMDWHRECTGQPESSSVDASSICYVSGERHKEDTKEEGHQVNILIETGNKECNARKSTSTNPMFIGLGIGFGSAMLFAFALVVIWLFVRRRSLGGPLVPQISLLAIAPHFSQGLPALPFQEHPALTLPCGPVPVPIPQEVTTVQPATTEYGQPVQPATNPMAYLASVVSYAVVDRLTSRRRR
uniref:Uncharacterized protein n=1 Tax=Oryza nivara TaxID=4536 RepID=A0A0E0G1P9_ORYNI